MERRDVGLRTRWAALGAAVAVAVGAGGWHVATATIDSGDRPVYVTVPGDRILDTRSSVGLAGRFADGAPRDLQVTGTVPVAPSGSKVVVPTGATGVVLTATVVGTTEAGFVSIRPKGVTGVPETSNVNFAAGQTVANSVTVDLPADGGIQIWYDSFAPGGTADVLIDVVAFLDHHTHDDRYFTEAEANAAFLDQGEADARYAPRTVTTSLSIRGFRETGSDVSGSWERCRTNLTDSTQIELPIDFPIGSTITRIVVDVYQRNSGFFGWELRVIRIRPEGVGNQFDTITNATGGGVSGGAQRVTQTFDLNETVDPNESFVLTFLPGGAAHNAVCSVEVTYTLPGA